MESIILQILKYAGFALAASAAIWGMVRKTTFEDPQGHKRLTPAGYVAIAFVLGSGLVSAGAFGVETIIKAQERDAKAQRDARDKEENARKEERETFERERAEARQLLTITLARANAAEVRARAAQQQTLTLALAAEERARQLALSEIVSRGAAANLAKAERALGEIARLLDPAGAPAVSLYVGFDEPPQLSEALQRAISDLADKPADFDWASIQGTALIDFPGEPKQLTAQQGSEIYPSELNDPGLARFIKDVRLHVVFYRYTIDSQELDGLFSQVSPPPYLMTGDFSFQIGTDPLIFYDTLPPRLDSIKLTGRPDTEAIYRSGTMSAVRDFEKSTMGIFVESGNRILRWKPASLILSIGGRSYSLPGTAFREVPTYGGLWLFDMRKVAGTQF